MQKAYLLKKKAKNSAQLKNYFEDSDEDDIRAPAPPPSTGPQDDDYDPLDAFMAKNEEQIVKDESVGTAILPEIVSEQDRSWDFEEVVHTNTPGSNDIEYDSDGIPVGTRKGDKAVVEPLPPVDHSSIKYRPFRKSFYREHSAISDMSTADVDTYRQDMQVAVMGTDVPRPIQSFVHAGFPAQLLREIARVGYEAPTAIQAQALPVAMSGRDVIGLAKTGSGKTLSFIWPMFIHILDQPQMEVGDGPICLVLAPTRELTAQIHNEAKKFAKVFNIRVCAVFGGEGKYQMAKALQEAPEIVIATPGRLIDLIATKATNLSRVTLVCLDEADRMFELGFEYQMRSIVNNIRPDRQTLLFSATMKKKIEGFAREILTNPIRVIVGSLGHANPDIQQIVELVPEAGHKWPWLACRIEGCIQAGKVLIFVSGKQDTEALAQQIIRHFEMRQYPVGHLGVECLHGDKSQPDRSSAIRRFKSGISSVLVATDVASRGLDIKDVRTVINYDAAKNIDTHVHRIGRTGRMGVDGVVPGVAYTLLAKTSASDRTFAVFLVKQLQDSGQMGAISTDLRQLAEADPQWARVMSGGGQGGGCGGQKGRTTAGLGLGYSTGSAGHQKAMTSSMLADMTSSSGHQVTGRAAVGVDIAVLKAYDKLTGNQCGMEPPSLVNPPDVAANPYIAGRSMGRGKHMTQPSWTPVTDSVSTTSSPPHSTEGTTGMVGKYMDATPSEACEAAVVPVTEPVKKRKNRFAELFRDTDSTRPTAEHAYELLEEQCPPPVAMPTVKTAPLPGFVRASGVGGLSSVTGTTSTPLDKSGAPLKKPKWQ